MQLTSSTRTVRRNDHFVSTLGTQRQVGPSRRFSNRDLTTSAALLDVVLVPIGPSAITATAAEVQQ
jgi:hypothetical protein